MTYVNMWTVKMRFYNTLDTYLKHKMFLKLCGDVGWLCSVWPRPAGGSQCTSGTHSLFRGRVHA